MTTPTTMLLLPREGSCSSGETRVRERMCDTLRRQQSVLHKYLVHPESARARPRAWTMHENGDDDDGEDDVLRANYSAFNARSEPVSSFKGIRRRDTQVYLCSDLTQQTHASASLRCSQASEVSCAAGRDEPREVTRVPTFGTGTDDSVT